MERINWALRPARMRAPGLQTGNVSDESVLCSSIWYFERARKRHPRGDCTLASSVAGGQGGTLATECCQIRSEYRVQQIGILYAGRSDDLPLLQPA